MLIDCMYGIQGYQFIHPSKAVIMLVHVVKLSRDAIITFGTKKELWTQIYSCQIQLKFAAMPCEGHKGDLNDFLITT